MADATRAKQDRILANQKAILRQLARLLANQKAILKNQRKILAK